MYETNIIPDVYISFCVLSTFHDTALFLKKWCLAYIQYILCLIENLKKSYSTEYILSCVGGGDLRLFSVEDVLNT